MNLSELRKQRVTSIHLFQFIAAVIMTIFNLQNTFVLLWLAKTLQRKESHTLAVFFKSCIVMRFQRRPGTDVHTSGDKESQGRPVGGLTISDGVQPPARRSRQRRPTSGSARNNAAKAHQVAAESRQQRRQTRISVFKISASGQHRPYQKSQLGQAGAVAPQLRVRQYLFKTMPSFRRNRLWYHMLSHTR